MQWEHNYAQEYLAGLGVRWYTHNMYSKPTHMYTYAHDFLQYKSVNVSADSKYGQFK